MAREIIVFVKDQLLDPAIMPEISERDGFFEVIKKATLENFKPLVWSPRSQKWVYIFYDDAEALTVRKELGAIDGITLKEMYLLRNTTLSKEQWHQIFEIKRIFGATIRAVPNKF